MKQSFDDFRNEYLAENEEIRAEYEKAKKELLEKQFEFSQKTSSKAYITTTMSKKRH